MASKTSKLIRVDVSRDYNDDGILSWLVTPYYRMQDGRVVSVPDSRGWSTKAEADAHAATMGR